MKQKTKILIVIAILVIIIISICVGIIFLKNSKEVNQTTEQEKNDSNNKTVNIEKENEISSYIPNNIKEIICINYMSDENNPTTYKITEIEKIKEFMNLFFETSWEEDIEFIETNHVDAFWEIEIIGEYTSKLKMRGLIGNEQALVQLKNDDVEKNYKISRNVYMDILAYTNETYYLHKSDIKLPDQETCNKAQEQALTNLTDAEVEQIKELLREAHLKLEYELIDAVRLIKDPTSPYWEDFTTEGIFTDPFNGIKVDNGGRFLDVLNQMEEIIQIEKEAETKKDLELMCNILKEGMEEHNLNKCFESHEILHDYDYFVFNTPVHLEVEPADWEGVETYFGRVSIMQ